MALIICEQRKRILQAKEHVLVTGGPGSGKTTIALAKARVRISDGLQPGQSVLFLSFSRAAVARIIEASKTEIPKDLQGRLSIQTFHSFFWETIRVHGYLLGAPRKLRLLLPHDEKALRFGREDDDRDWLAERERLFYDQGLTVFDLFAPKAHALLCQSQRICRLTSDRYPLIIVDEAQDTAEDQWACIKLLADNSQIVCLADLDQQIYDFRPGVTSERVTHIMQALQPLRVDLEAQNHRSPNVEIIKFGNDILLNTPRGAAYGGVSRKGFRSDAEHRDAAIRSTVGIIYKNIKEATGYPPKSIAVLATWGRGVGIISRALTGGDGTKPIRHQVLIDEASVLLSSRLVAFLLEPKRSDGESIDLAEALELVAAMFRAKGKKTHLEKAERLSKYAEQARRGESVFRPTVARELLAIIRELQVHSFTGQPKRDWLEVRHRLRRSSVNDLALVASEAEQLMVFNRGQRIAADLSEAWQTGGGYVRARSILDEALAEDQLISNTVNLSGVFVMTIHKAKGKEFDGVVIVDESRNCPLIFCKESPPHSRSRRLLRVGVTRARHHVLLLTDLYRPSDILRGHKL